MKKIILGIILGLAIITTFTTAKESNKKTKTHQKTKYNCNKNYCKYMTDCKEAYYKLEQCGMKALDRDRDGIPCENICGH